MGKTGKQYQSNFVENVYIELIIKKIKQSISFLFMVYI
jgi:hypothetical protein